MWRVRSQRTKAQRGRRLALAGVRARASIPECVTDFLRFVFQVLMASLGEQEFVAELEGRIADVVINLRRIIFSDEIVYFATEDMSGTDIQQDKPKGLPATVSQKDKQQTKTALRDQPQGLAPRVHMRAKLHVKDRHALIGMVYSVGSRTQNW